MKPFLGAGLLIVLTAGSAAAQDSKIYSDPALPSREVLDRLNMRMAWRVNVPVDGKRDGFLSIQLHGGQVVAATRNGVVASYDAETGRELWKIVVGKPDDATFTPTFNSKSILVVRGVQLYAIDRFKGSIQWQYTLPFGLASSPVADERQIYLSGVNSQVAAYSLPGTGSSSIIPGDPTLRTGDSKEARYQMERDNLVLREVKPNVMWQAATKFRLDFTPVMTRDSLFYASPDGYLFLYGKYPLTGDPIEAYRHQIDKRLTVPPGVYEEMVYLPTGDQNLHAVSVTSGRTKWRYSAGGAITKTPFATDTDVYIAVERRGLVRLDRETGQTLWKLPYGRTTTEAVAEADCVLAVNNKFVYAADTGGRLRVLDRATGKQLSYYEPFRDYNFQVHNETSDRLMLAANNGLIVCLHDREYEKPLLFHKNANDANTPEARSKQLKDKLAQKVSLPEGGAIPFIDVLENFRQRYGILIIFSERAFTDAGQPSPKDKSVLQQRVENMEVGEVLKGILAQVSANYDIVGDTIYVLPLKRVAMNPNPMENPKPIENIDPKIRELLAKKVDSPNTDKYTLTDFLEFAALRFDVTIEVDKKAFMAAGIDPEATLRMEITYPKGKAVPVSQVLRDCFAQVKGEYEVRGDTIVLVPKK